MLFENREPPDVLSVANKELIKVCRRTAPSVLRLRSYEGLSSEHCVSEVLNEMASRCPMVFKILSCLFECDIYPQKKNPAMCLIYGIMLFMRCHELSKQNSKDQFCHVNRRSCICKCKLFKNVLN